jgi:hypothetical protein
MPSAICLWMGRRWKLTLDIRIPKGVLLLAASGVDMIGEVDQEPLIDSPSPRADVGVRLSIDVVD